MGTGYTRNDTSNNIAPGNTIDAADLDGEFDAIEAAFVETTGHDHSGAADNGAPITVIGPAQDYVGGASDFSPKTDSTYDLGKIAVRWANGYLDNLNTATATVSGVLTVDLSTVSSTGDLGVANGGTGSSTAAGARTNLGLVIGTDVQAWDTNLDQIAALAVTDGNIIVGNGSAWVAESGATARASLGLTIGTDVQAYSSVLANTTASFTTADETKLDGIDEQTSFAPVTVSGTTPTLDLSSGNFFHQVSVAADTTLSFSNVPTEARWTYVFKVEPISTSSIGFMRETSTCSLDNTQTRGLFVSPDGKHGLTLDSSDQLYSFDIESPYDLSTAKVSTLITRLSGTSQNTNMVDFTAKPDGTKVYMLGTTTPASVFSYTLSTSWDTSTGTYDSSSLNVSAQTTSPTQIRFKSDGTKLYVLSAGTIYQYGLSTAWDLSTATYDSVTGTAGTITSFDFNSTGTVLIGATGNSFFQFSLSTAWDLSTLTADTSVGQSGTVGYDSQSHEIGNIIDNNERLYTSTSGTDYGAGHAFSIADYPLVTLPAAVQNTSSVQTISSDRYSLDFFTLDSGTTVFLKDYSSSGF